MGRDLAAVEEQQQQQLQLVGAAGMLGTGVDPSALDGLGGGGSNLLNVQMMHARALRLHAAHHERQGSAELGAQTEAQAAAIDAKFGFDSKE